MRSIRRHGFGGLFAAVSMAALAVVAATAIIPHYAAAAKTPVPPTVKEAFRIILANGDVKLSSTSCDSVKGPGDKTLSDYLATMLTTQSDPTIGWHTEVRPTAVPGARARWQVDVKFLGVDPGDNYDMGVGFIVDDATRKMDRRSLMCIGTS
jgi:hypothetical protein